MAIAALALGAAVFLNAENMLIDTNKLGMYPFEKTYLVSDRDLATINGRYAPESMLHNIPVIADAQRSENFRNIGDVSKIQLDIWWGTIGSELIATSVRSSIQ